MSGSVSGGKLAAQKNLAKDPDFYRKLAAVGGKLKLLNQRDSLLILNAQELQDVSQVKLAEKD